MKKILSLGVAAAVVSLTAVAASAAINPVIIDEAVAGKTITVEVTANGMTLIGTEFTVEASDNLTLVDFETGSVGSGLFNEDAGVFAWANTAPAADGTVLLTLTYTVDGAADEAISVDLIPADYCAADFDGIGAEATIVAGADDNIDDIPGDDIPGDDTGDDNTGDDGIIDGGDDNTGDDNTGDDAGDAGDDESNANTGIALAVVPAVLAGAAIVVSKKRK